MEEGKQSKNKTKQKNKTLNAVFYVVYNSVHFDYFLFSLFNSADVLGGQK